MTISRTGIIGTRFRSCFSRVNIGAPEKLTTARSGLSGLFEQTPIDFPSADHFRGNHKVAHLALHREVVHEFEHEVFKNHAQATSADFALHGKLGDSVESVVGETQTNILEFEEPLVLLEQRVLGLCQNTDKHALVQVVHHACDRQAADKFGNQAIADQIAGLYLLEQFGVAATRRRRRGVGVKTERMAASALFDNFLEADESASADKQDVRGVDRSKFLVRVLAAALRRHVGDGALQDFQQCLLDAFAAYVARDRRVLVLLGNLVDLVDIDDALLGFLDVAIGGLQQLENNVFNVFADVAGFGKCGGVHDGERNVQHARESLREKRLPRARGPNQ